MLSLAFIYRVYLIPSHNLIFDCCQTVTNQQVTYIQQPQPTFTGGQGGVVIIQPTGAVTATHGYPVAGQPAMYLPQQVSFMNL